MKIVDKYSVLKSRVEALLKKEGVSEPDNLYYSIEKLFKENESENKKFELQKSISQIEIEQNEIEKQRSYLSAIIENTENFCCIKDLNLRIIAANKSFANALGKRPEDMIGKTDAEIFHIPEDQDPVKSYMADERKAQLLKKGDQIIREEVFVYPDKSTKNVVTSKFPVYDDNNRLLATANISTDISKLKKAEQTIKKQGERFKLMINNSNDTFVLLDENGTQTFVSNSVEDVTDPNAESNLRPFAELLHPDDLPRVNEVFKNILADDTKRHTVQYRHKHRKKGWVWLEAVAQNYLKNHALQSVLVNVREISRQKEHELLIESQKSELLKLNEDKNRFMQILGHDLRAPFNALLGLSNILTDEIDELTKDEIKEIALAIKKASNTTYELLDDLLLWAKSQSGSLHFEPKAESIKNIYTEVKTELNYTAQQKQISITYYEDEHAIAEVDKNMFKTIFRNLISNAIKFSDKNSVITMTCKKIKQQLLITVSDRGTGIRREHLDKIWNNSSLYSTLGTENEKGTGFGLLLVKDFVEKHKGSIKVESEYGKGSDFIISIPIKILHKEEEFK